MCARKGAGSSPFVPDMSQARSTWTPFKKGQVHFPKSFFGRPRQERGVRYIFLCLGMPARADGELAVGERFDPIKGRKGHGEN